MGEVKGLTPLMVLCTVWTYLEFLHSVMEDDQYCSILNFQSVDDEGATVMHHAARGRDPGGTLTLMLQEESLSAALAKVSKSSKYTNTEGTKVTQMMLVQSDNLGYTPGHYLLSRKDVDANIFSKMLCSSRELSHQFSKPTTKHCMETNSRISLARLSYRFYNVTSLHNERT